MTVPCPVWGEPGELCEAPIECPLEYTPGWFPGEMYGQDADGNRGVWQSGYFEVCDIPNECPEGHDLKDRMAEIERVAQLLADEYEPPDMDDYGPDTIEEAEDRK